MAKKYIIEIEDGKEGIILCQKGIVTVGLHLENESELKPLGIQSAIPYTEPDIKQVKEEAYLKGLNDGQGVIFESTQNNAFNNGYKKCLEDMEQVRKEERDRGYEDGYHQGLDDAWEAARKIMLEKRDGGFTLIELMYIFGSGIQDIFKTHTAIEAIEEIRAHEQAQKEKESEESKKEQSVTAEEVMRQYLDTFCKGSRCRECVLNTSDFTCGRGYHFLTNSRISDEEVRKAYATVLEKERK